MRKWRHREGSQLAAAYTAVRDRARMSTPAGWPQSLCPRELARLPPNGLFLIVLSVALLLMGARDGFSETETVKAS